MSAALAHSGSAAIPEPEQSMPPTSHADMDAAVDTLQRRKSRWADTSVSDRIQLLQQLSHAVLAEAPRWVQCAVNAKGIEPNTPDAAEEWLGGPVVILRNLRLLIKALQDIQTHGTPQLPKPAYARANGQVVAPVFPNDIFDQLLFQGFTAEVWMQHDVTLNNLAQTQATIYHTNVPPKVALVLGAGNVSSIGPMDALYKLFVENQVVILKMNPVNAYVGPCIERAFHTLVEAGFLRVVYGGAAEGQYLCHHDGVEEIHITGSDKTHDAIVFGVGETGAARKAARSPLLHKRITSELGNVSPVIVVPGEWTAEELNFHGANIASQLANNAGFNCNAVRVIITHAEWPQRQALLDAVRHALRNKTPRKAYYPGAKDRWQAFVQAHPTAELLGAPAVNALPWTLIPNVDPEHVNDICLTTEAFCSVTSEVPLHASDAATFISDAVALCNKTIWGSLNAAIIVHPKSLKNENTKNAFDSAIADLRYGSVAINHWPALAYAFCTTTWGAFPGHPLENIQSGQGVVHNTLMFDKPEKSVVRGPFMVRPKPAWFLNHRQAHRVAEKFASFEAQPAWRKLPALLWEALRS